MKEFFKHFPPEFSEKTAFKMMVHKLDEAFKKCKDDDERYLEDLSKLKDMIELYLQEAS